MNIENWSFFQNHGAVIQAMEFQDEEGTFYQGAISICLDDGQPLSEDVNEQNWVTIGLDIFTETPEDCLLQMAKGSLVLFGSTSENALIIKESGDIEDFDLTPLLEG